MVNDYKFVSVAGRPQTRVMGHVAIVPSWSIVLSLLYAGLFHKDSYVVVHGACVNEITEETR